MPTTELSLGHSSAIVAQVGNTGDDLDVEVEPGEPVDADRRPIRIGRLRKHLAFCSYMTGSDVTPVTAGWLPFEQTELL